jgi:hypothetical protein
MKLIPVLWTLLSMGLAIFLMTGQLGGLLNQHNHRPVKTQMDSAIAAIPVNDRWQNLKADSNAQENYSYTIMYKRDPTPVEARNDAEAVAAVGVKIMQQAGMERLLEDSPVVVYTERDAGSTSAQPHLRGFGYAQYDPDHATIIWHEPGS